MQTVESGGGGGQSGLNKGKDVTDLLRVLFQSISLSALVDFQTCLTPVRFQSSNSEVELSKQLFDSVCALLQVEETDVR